MKPLYNIQMKKCFYFIFISFLIFSCKKIEKEPSPNILKTNNSDSIIRINENKKILSKIINSFDKAKKIAITEQSTIQGITQDEKKLDSIKFSHFSYRLKCLDEDTFNDFILKNKFSIKIKDDFYTQKNIVILKEQEIKETFKDFIYIGWKNFYKKFGEETQGLLTLSRIGYNDKKNRAMIYYSNQSNSTNGTGYIMILEKINSKWKICSSTMVWIS